MSLQGLVDHLGRCKSRPKGEVCGVAITTLTVKVQIENQNEFIMVLVVFLEIFYGFSGVNLDRRETFVCGH